MLHTDVTAVCSQLKCTTTMGQLPTTVRPFSHAFHIRFNLSIQVSLLHIPGLWGAFYIRYLHSVLFAPLRMFVYISVNGLCLHPQKSQQVEVGSVVRASIFGNAFKEMQRQKTAIRPRVRDCNGDMSYQEKLRH